MPAADFTPAQPQHPAASGRNDSSRSRRRPTLTSGSGEHHRFFEGVRALPEVTLTSRALALGAPWPSSPALWLQEPH